MCFNKEVIQQISQAQITFEWSCLMGSTGKIFRVRSRNAYQHVSAFDRCRIVAYRDCGLSYRNAGVPGWLYLKIDTAPRN